MVANNLPEYDCNMPSKKGANDVLKEKRSKRFWTFKNLTKLVSSTHIYRSKASLPVLDAKKLTMTVEKFSSEKQETENSFRGNGYSDANQNFCDNLNKLNQAAKTKSVSIRNQSRCILDDDKLEKEICRVVERLHYLLDMYGDEKVNEPILHEQETGKLSFKSFWDDSSKILSVKLLPEANNAVSNLYHHRCDRSKSTCCRSLDNLSDVSNAFGSIPVPSHSVSPPSENRLISKYSTDSGFFRTLILTLYVVMRSVRGWRTKN